MSMPGCLLLALQVLGGGELSPVADSANSPVVALAAPETMLADVESHDPKFGESWFVEPHMPKAMLTYISRRSHLSDQYFSLSLRCNPSRPYLTEAQKWQEDKLPLLCDQDHREQLLGTDYDFVIPYFINPERIKVELVGLCKDSEEVPTVVFRHEDSYILRPLDLVEPALRLRLMMLIEDDAN